MLEGNTTIRPQLDAVTTYNVDDQALFSELLAYPIYSKNASGHWMKTGANRYVYQLGDSTNVVFDYNTTTGSFDCDHMDENCKQLTH
jgi:hypothetical protein